MDDTTLDAESPFAGRQNALLRLDQYLKDPGPNSALLILGKRWQGKTALLRYASSFFDAAAITVYVPCRARMLESERQFFQTIIDGSAQAVVSHDISASRLPPDDSLADDLRPWLDEVWLPEIGQVIRAHRHLLLLLDDADLILDAIAAGNLPDDCPAFLADLLGQHPQLKLVLSFPVEREAELEKLSPLINAGQSLRLSNFTAEETAWLLRTTAAAAYRVSDDAAQAVQQASGGQPLFVGRFASALDGYYADRPSTGSMTPEIIRTLTPAVYQASQAELEAFWAASSDNEQLMLLGLSRLHFEDPLRKLDAAALEEWLINSEFPLDQTTINAALRSLEYRELVTQRAGGIALSSDLFQTWLLNHSQQELNRAGQTASRPRVLVALLAVALVILALVILVSLSNSPQASGGGSAQATVTLATGE